MVSFSGTTSGVTTVLVLYNNTVCEGEGKKGISMTTLTKGKTEGERGKMREKREVQRRVL